MAAVACNSSHRTTHDVELSYTNINNAAILILIMLIVMDKPPMLMNDKNIKLNLVMSNILLYFKLAMLAS